MPGSPTSSSVAGRSRSSAARARIDFSELAGASDEPLPEYGHVL